jgi:hypothetical protein
MRIFDTAVAGIGTLSALAAALLFWWSSRIVVPNSQDDFIDALQEIGKWNSYGCWAAVVAALCGAWVFARSFYVSIH